MVKNIITIILIVFVVASLGIAASKGFKGNENSDDPPQINSPVGPDGPDTISDPGSDQNQTDIPSDPEDELIPVTAAADNLNPNRLRVYYFHRSLRCTGCVNVETGSYEAIAIDHNEQVEAGTIEWHSINFEESEYAHFETEFGLYSQELIFVEYRDNQVVRHEKIAEVWQHWSDKEAIRKIVNETIDQWLGGINRS